VKVQLGRLQALEYVAVHYQGHRQRHLYELLTAATDAPSALCEYDANRSGNSSDRSATGPLSESPVLLKQDAQMREPVRLGKRTSQERANGAAYRSGISSLAAEAASSAIASTTATAS
jgi:hypothetical protein